MKVALGSRTYDVESSVQGETLRLLVDGVPHSIPFRRLPDGGVLLDVGGRRIRAFSDCRTATANGRARTVRPLGAAGKAPVASLSPPMPAMVTGVLVAVGDSVTQGQKLVLLTAMKTEIAIRSPRDGIVEIVRAVAGEQAMPGTDLVVLA